MVIKNGGYSMTQESESNDLQDIFNESIKMYGEIKKRINFLTIAMYLQFALIMWFVFIGVK